MKLIQYALYGLLLLHTTAFAGSLDNSGNPANGSGMPSTTAIYNRLDSGAEISIPGAFQEPAAGPAASGRTLAEIAAKLPAADNSNGAALTDVLSGKTFWGLRTDGTWGLKSGTYTPPAAPTGTATADKVLSGETFSNAGGVGITGAMPNNGVANFTPAATAVVVPAGYYSAGQVNTDTNLVAGNIKAGTTIFGVVGSLLNTPLYRIVNKTGQTQCWDADGIPLASCAGTGQDGGCQYGIDPAIAPAGGTTGAYNTPAFSGTRFIDNGNGTITDTLTALIWQKDSSCHGTKTWTTALTACNGLSTNTCGLSDDSTAGQWRLPNINELHSLGPNWPLVAPFQGNLSSYYWSSTTGAGSTSHAWGVDFGSAAAIRAIPSTSGACVADSRLFGSLVIWAFDVLDMWGYGGASPHRTGNKGTVPITIKNLRGF